ncbi:MAG: aldehyde dehydrogenase family protein [Acidimicrobiales bacterium]
MAATTIGGPYRLLIGGEWIDASGGTYDIVNPATEDVVDRSPEATVDDAKAACAAARAAADGWARTKPEERARLLDAVATKLNERGKEYLDLVIAETGATLSVGSSLQVPQAVTRFRDYARRAVKDLSIPLPPSAIGTTPLAPGGLMGGIALRHPVGVVACIASYNFPLVNMAGKVAPALAAGNTVVMKPAPQDPLMLIELARICDEVGFPPGVVNIVTSSRAEPAAVLVESPDVDCVSFTGSTAIGGRIFAAGGPTMKRLLLELGGKGAALVLGDADVNKAVTALISVWAFHSGQICTAPTRAIVHRSLYDELVSKLAAAAPALAVGAPTDPKTIVGPVISAAHRERVETYIRSGPAEGAQLVVGGDRPPIDKGFYVAPTLLAGCTNQMTAAREEIFGPVIVVIPFDDEEEGIAIANDSPYGLYDYVFGEDTARAYDVAKRLKAGNVGINTAQRNHEAPFGGWKMSGVGRDGGDFGLYAYTELQSVIWPG